MGPIEQELQSLADGPKGSPVFFVEVDHEGRYKYGAGELAHALEYTPEQLPATVFELVSPNARQKLRGFWEAVCKGRSVHQNEFAFHTAGNEPRSFGLSLFPVFDAKLNVAAVRLVLSRLDIQKELSYALESAEERFSTVFQASSDAIMILAPSGQLLSANPAFEQMVGKTVDAFFRGECTLRDFLPEEHAADFEQLLSACGESGEDQQGEFCLRVKSDELRWFDVRLHALKNTEEQIKGVLCIGRDVHGYREIVDALREEAAMIEARRLQAQDLIGRLKEFLARVHSLPKDALPFVQGLASILAKLYPSSLLLLHVEDEVREIISGSSDERLNEQELHLLNSTMNQLASESESPLYCSALDATSPYAEDALVRYLGLKSFIGAPMRDADGTLLGTILLMDSADARYDSEDVEIVTVAAIMAAGRLRSDADAADKRELESHLRQSQKMQAVGKLAGGIAHDFNNILSGILGFSSYLLRNAESGTDLHRDLTMIMKSAERASALTRQLLSFSRKRHIEKKVVDINSVIREVESIITHSAAKKITLHMELSDNLGPVLADEGQIHQVIMNLCINACDAMGRNKGSITVRSTERRLEEKELQVIEHPDEQAETYVVIQVQDSGPGIPEDIREHLFEPFFTTKPEDEGTGLGLSIVYGIVTNHDGGILVDSEPGEGATFTIMLPVCELPDETSATEEERDASLRGSEWILVVDDEAIVRQMAAQTLRAYGYEVSTATSGKEAVAQVAEQPGKFDLVLMDLNMPGRVGVKSLRQIAEIDPHISATAMSTFPAEGRCKTILPDRTVAFLQKPFTADMLATTIRNHLDT